MLKLSDEWLDEHTGIWLVDSSKEPNYDSLDSKSQKDVDDQILEMINTRFKFINYNNSRLSYDLKEMLDIQENGEIGKNIFHHSVVIVDEAHMLMSMLYGEGRRLKPLYDALYTARDCRMVFLTGTPVINDAFELSTMFNLLRGRIDTFYLPSPPIGFGLNAEQILKQIPSLDTIEWNNNKRKWMITRNPLYFVSVYDASGNRTAVKYDKNKNRAETNSEFLTELKLQLEKKGWSIDLETINTEYSSALPTDRKVFYDTFLDTNTLKVKNEQLFMRRLQGLVSYFKGVDERMVPERIDVEDTLVEVKMSHEQYVAYQQERRKEILDEAKKARFRISGQDLPSTYMSATRLACNYAIPMELKELSAAEETEVADTEDTETIARKEKKQIKKELLDKLVEKREEYFSKEALARNSPKFLAILNAIQEGVGTQLIYSAFRNAEGIGFFGEVLKTNGFREYKVKKGEEKGQWVPDVEGKGPFFAYFSGNEDDTEREIYRQIFNSDWQSLKKEHPLVYEGLVKDYGEELTNLRGEIMKVFMVSRSGAAGITLKNVRHVHVMEPFWNPAMIDQVIGRAIRVCSHSALPVEERNVKVSIYMTVFNEDIYNPSEDNAALLRKQDTIAKRYYEEFRPGAGMKAPEPATTDEQLYEIAYEKRTVIQQFTKLMKQAAIDCEIHKPLHSTDKEQPICLRYDTRVKPEDLAYKSNIKFDELDVETRMNVETLQHKLQMIRVLNQLFLLEPANGHIYDVRIFEMSKRLLKLGVMQKDKILFEK